MIGLDGRADDRLRHVARNEYGKNCRRERSVAAPIAVRTGTSIGPKRSLSMRELGHGANDEPRTARQFTLAVRFATPSPLLFYFFRDTVEAATNLSASTDRTVLSGH